MWISNIRLLWPTKTARFDQNITWWKCGGVHDVVWGYRAYTILHWVLGLQDSALEPPWAAVGWVGSSFQVACASPPHPAPASLHPTTPLLSPPLLSLPRPSSQGQPQPRPLRAGGRLTLWVGADVPSGSPAPTFAFKLFSQHPGSCNRSSRAGSERAAASGHRTPYNTVLRPSWLDSS